MIKTPINKSIPDLVMRRRFGSTGAISVPEDGGTDFPVGETPPEEAVGPTGAATEIPINNQDGSRNWNGGRRWT
jgi:hypothetical protein